MEHGAAQARPIRSSPSPKGLPSASKRSTRGFRIVSTQPQRGEHPPAKGEALASAGPRMTGGLKGRDTIGRMPQSHATVLVHAVFSTKDRTPWLAPAIRQELHPYIVGVLAKIGCPSIQTGGVEDHVHVLCCRSMNGICAIESRPFRPHPLLRHFLCPGLRPSLLDERPFGPTWRQGRPPTGQARGQDA
ncbi:MAG: transposase, partial [Armatimonadetes bacterium OLB18]